MAKNELTKKLEKAIMRETSEWFGCLEVTIGWYGRKRVDFMTMDSKEIFRCFEIKISKADFYSKHGHNFVGHFNYYVMPIELFEEVKEKLPKHVYAVYFEPVKLDLERILEDACEDHVEDIEYSLEGVEDLRKVIDKFNEVNSSVGTYNLDVDKVIKL
ncbi:hypothetical protein QJR26_04315 [Clostridium baratii]